jgi:3-hydroxybutyryl-CoA dehydratase
VTSQPTLKEIVLLIDAQGIRRYAELTNDFNPIHVDPEFAARSGMGGVIAHGTLSLNLIWQSLAATVGVQEIQHLDLKVRFKAPARIGDRLAAGGRATDTGYEVYVRNQHGINIIEGSAIRRQANEREYDQTGRTDRSQR